MAGLIRLDIFEGCIEKPRDGLGLASSLPRKVFTDSHLAQQLFVINPVNPDQTATWNVAISCHMENSAQARVYNDNDTNVIKCKVTK